LAIGLLAAEARQFDVAGRYFEQAIAAKTRREGTLLSTWGLSLLVSERYADAAKVFQRAVDEHAISADNAAMQFYLAGALAMAGQDDAAVAAARRAAASPEATPEYLFRLGWVLFPRPSRQGSETGDRRRAGPVRHRLLDGRRADIVRKRG